MSSSFRLPFIRLYSDPTGSYFHLATDDLDSDTESSTDSDSASDSDSESDTDSDSDSDLLYESIDELASTYSDYESDVLSSLDELNTSIQTLQISVDDLATSLLTYDEASDSYVSVTELLDVSNTVATNTLYVLLVLSVLCCGGLGLALARLFTGGFKS